MIGELTITATLGRLLRLTSSVKDACKINSAHLLGIRKCQRGTRREMIRHLLLRRETDIEENSSELLPAVAFEHDDVSCKSSCCASKPIRRVKGSDLSSHNSAATSHYSP